MKRRQSASPGAELRSPLGQKRAADHRALFFEQVGHRCAHPNLRKHAHVRAKTVGWGERRRCPTSSQPRCWALDPAPSAAHSRTPSAESCTVNQRTEAFTLLKRGTSDESAESCQCESPNLEEWSLSGLRKFATTQGGHRHQRGRGVNKMAAGTGLSHAGAIRTVSLRPKREQAILRWLAYESRV